MNFDKTFRSLMEYYRADSAPATTPENARRKLPMQQGKNIDHGIIPGGQYSKHKKGPSNAASVTGGFRGANNGDLHTMKMKLPEFEKPKKKSPKGKRSKASRVRNAPEPNTE